MLDMGRPSPPLMMPKTRTLWALKVSICSLIFFFLHVQVVPRVIPCSRKIEKTELKQELFIFLFSFYLSAPSSAFYYKSRSTFKHIPCLLTPQSHNHKWVTLGRIPTPISGATFSWLESTYKKEGKKKKPQHFAYILSESTCQKG